MPSFGHVAVGLAAGRLQSRDGPRLRSVLVLTALATFPDLDVFALGGRHVHWLHRGASHSLLVAALAALAGAFLLDRGRGFAVAFLIAFATAASHGLLDTVTYGGSGVMLLWPFSVHRFVAPLHPIQASPMGLRLFTPHGLGLMAREALLFSPLLVYALWPRRGARAGLAPISSVTSSGGRNEDDEPELSGSGSFTVRRREAYRAGASPRGPRTTTSPGRNGEPSR